MTLEEVKKQQESLPALPKKGAQESEFGFRFSGPIDTSSLD